MKNLFIALTVMLLAGAAQAEQSVISCNSAVGNGLYKLVEDGKDYIMRDHVIQKDGSLKKTTTTYLEVRTSQGTNQGVLLTGVAETQRQVDVFQVEDFKMLIPRNIEKDALFIDFINQTTGDVRTIKMYCTSTL